MWKHISVKAHFSFQMDGGGFEPPKQFAADLQSVPFGHSGIHPCPEQSLAPTLYIYIIGLSKKQGVSGFLSFIV